MARFKMVLNPSICPLCRAHSDSVDHVFYSCDKVKSVWDYFMGILGIPTLHQTISIRQIFISWWLKAGSKKLEGIFKHCLPGIICWQIWKSYFALVWGSEDTCPTSVFLISQIKVFTQNWVRGFSSIKQTKVGEVLYEEGLIPLSFRLPRPTIQATL
ncbi:unnamed protein product [Cuscuta europaea]|uniref:Reverse transcriptase zinc-binding domain-containing protein n=1 Tax=Cuscuta europaea TaxID=41803 RepID=A0A9P0YCH7_CUSEU|nr:unnamed protein product [Cuscuta europaea]